MTDNHRFLCGLGVGVAAGLLMAPWSGAKTRALIAGSAKEGRKVVKKQTAEARDAAADAIERGKEAVKQTADGIVEAFESGKRALVG